MIEAIHAFARGYTTNAYGHWITGGERLAQSFVERSLSVLYLKFRGGSKVAFSFPFLFRTRIS
jgi:hypothetical protein